MRRRTLSLIVAGAITVSVLAVAGIAIWSFAEPNSFKRLSPEKPTEHDKYVFAISRKSLTSYWEGGFKAFPPTTDEDVLQEGKPLTNRDVSSYQDFSIEYSPIVRGKMVKGKALYDTHGKPLYDKYGNRKYEEVVKEQREPRSKGKALVRFLVGKGVQNGHEYAYFRTVTLNSESGRWQVESFGYGKSLVGGPYSLSPGVHYRSR